jgi:hypothetical protein
MVWNGFVASIDHKTSLLFYFEIELKRLLVIFSVSYIISFPSASIESLFLCIMNVIFNALSGLSTSFELS